MECAFEIAASWDEALEEELEKPYMQELAAFVERERQGKDPVYPPEEQVFRALELTPYKEVKAVIVGQDPYHGPGQAEGLCFSVGRGVAVPPSLKNVYKELHEDLGIAAPRHGNLLKWARQGVLLLNATLTVRHKNPLSHHGKGWERFTDAVIEKLCEREEPVIFVLWGKNAQDKCLRIKGMERHYLLKAAHPSPFSAHRGFFGCRHFSRINRILADLGKEPIDWNL